MTVASPRTASLRSWRRLARQVFLTWQGASGFAIVVFWLLCALLAPTLLGAAAGTIQLAERLQPPSWAHLLGTDALGRDNLARVLVASQLTFVLTLGAVAVGTVLGVLVGTLAAVMGVAARRVLTQITSAATAFPSIILALLLATVLGRSGWSAMIALGIASAPATARLVLNLTGSVASRDYVVSARMIGVSRARLLSRHIVPNVIEPIVTLTIVTMGAALITIASLSFLGIGVQSPQYDWGSMISDAMQSLYVAPWPTLAPIIAIVSAGVGFSLFGETVAQFLDPRGLVDTPLRRAPRRRRSLRAAATTADAVGHEPVPTVAATPLPADCVVGVRNLRIRTSDERGERVLVHGVDIAVRPGEKVGIVGESGSGKSLTLAALAHMLPGGLVATTDEQRFFGEDLDGLSRAQLRRRIGAKIPMIFQDPMSSLNPTLTIGRQLLDKLSAHTTLRGADARRAALAALEQVGIPDPEHRFTQHPHELSGGQRQRVMIAMATLGDARAILADEPTTALDVSVQAQVVELLRRVNEQRGVAIVMVSHDLALISQLCDRIVVMYDGRIVEEGPTASILADPTHPYTVALLGAVPDLSRGIEHRLSTVNDYSWNTDEYRAAHPVARHGAAPGPAGEAS